MLVKCCLILISIIIPKYFLYLLYLCPCLDVGLFMSFHFHQHFYRHTSSFSYLLEYVLLFLHDNVDEECE